MNNKIIYLLAFVIIILITYKYLSHGLKPESFSTKELEDASKTNINDKNISADIKVKYFESEGKVRIAYFPHISKDERASLIFIHGGGAHSNAGYQYIAEALKDQYNISTYLMDLRGHGLSGDRRGDAQEVEFVYKDLQNLTKIINSTSDKPIFLGGHSSGCGVILNYTTYLNTDNIAGFIFVSPEFGYKANIKRDNIKEPFAQPRTWVFALSAISGSRLFNHTKAVYFNYPKAILADDKLILNFYTTNMARVCTPEEPEEQLSKINKPVQILIGENDELLDPEKLQRFFLLLNNGIKPMSTYKVIHDTSHLSVLLRCGSEIGGRIINWTNK
ncbi:MAG: alpha/beta fold hydrolase [Spirochaetes bacterium]|nr:alpha/beta fold hydrolase [Spirochaetota bacterium]